MFQASFYPMAVKLYTDNVRASLTNSMSIKVRASFQAIEVTRSGLGSYIFFIFLMYTGEWGLALARCNKILAGPVHVYLCTSIK